MPRLPDSIQIYILNRVGFRRDDPRGLHAGELRCCPPVANELGGGGAFIQSPSDTKADRELVDGTGIKES